MEQQLTDLDHFLLRNNQQPTPKRSYASQINRHPPHHPSHKNHQQLKENQPLIRNQSRSPARCSSKNTLSSQDNSQSSLRLSRQRAKSRKSVKVIRRYC